MVSIQPIDTGTGFKFFPAIESPPAIPKPSSTDTKYVANENTICRKQFDHLASDLYNQYTYEGSNEK